MARNIHKEFNISIPSGHGFKIWCSSPSGTGHQRLILKMNGEVAKILSPEPGGTRVEYNWLFAGVPYDISISGEAKKAEGWTPTVADVFVRSDKQFGFGFEDQYSEFFPGGDFDDLQAEVIVVPV